MQSTDPKKKEFPSPISTARGSGLAPRALATCLAIGLQASVLAALAVGCHNGDEAVKEPTAELVAIGAPPAPGTASPGQQPSAMQPVQVPDFGNPAVADSSVPVQPPPPKPTATTAATAKPPSMPTAHPPALGGKPMMPQPPQIQQPRTAGVPPAPTQPSNP